MGRGRSGECSQFCIFSHRDQLFQLTAFGSNPILEQLKTAEADPEKTEEAKSLLEQLISGIFEVVYRLTGVSISNLHILDIIFEATSENKANVRIPITAEGVVNLPVLGEIVVLALNLVLQYSFSIETD
nr:PREDICTED: short palate, lung and nasal epithelium carcinoma-associated protein 2A [Bos mutus]